WSDHELAHKVKSAAMKVSRTPATTLGLTTASQAAWPVVNEEQRAAVIRDGMRLADLWESSPIRADWHKSQAEAVIDQLFPGNPLLCVGSSAGSFHTKPRAEFRYKLSLCPFITPNPMCAPTGLTQDGRTSEHTLENTGPRRFLVTEFDQGEVDDHAALLGHLA